ncbi:hypothetical protein PMEL_200127 [Prevotella melaninogenica]|uniref:Uncharacterized protein n=1 Tax=Prevotella melaninogenica TaxID=28132 RepID=A0A250KJ32_9BACT|nr:hypothetical protein PMEL_200127 [Prevotella melaninogenica]
MIDKRQQSIKERLRRFVMDLWNITDLRQMGPVIDLILHKCIRGCKAPGVI